MLETGLKQTNIESPKRDELLKYNVSSEILWWIFYHIHMCIAHYGSVKGFIKFQIVHAFLDREWDPETKIQIRSFCYFQPLYIADLIFCEDYKKALGQYGF